MPALTSIIEWLVVACAVAAALAYALLALAPQAVKRALAVRLGPRAPAWLARRLVPRGGCAGCPANALNQQAPRR